VHVFSFPPIANAKSRLLILGSMPGKASLEANEYYAHPRNLFWEFAADHFGFDRDASYAERVAALEEAGVALWDVLKSCRRTSSLDSDIVESSIVVNPFGKFLAAHPAIATVCFNGAKAESVFKKHVLPDLPHSAALSFQRLPSTSPANAGIPLTTKRKQWAVALLSAGGSRRP
jgi:TDG/mug DNA glycosylase family protein